MPSPFAPSATDLDVKGQSVDIDSQDTGAINSEAWEWEDPNTHVAPRLKLKSPWVLEAMPPGVILPYGGASAPSGFLMCDGTVKSETTYATLFAVIGHGFGPGAPTDPGGGNFYLPDFQGVSPTGPGSQNISGRAKTGPALGYTREDLFQGHCHDMMDANTVICRYGGGGDRTFAFTGTVSNAGWSKTGSPLVDGVPNGTPRTGAYTHGPEIGVNWIIKY